jgi:hypothetical protein
MKSFVFIPLLLLFSISLQAQFMGGEKVIISEPYPDDVYIAGGEVSINAPVYGDCVLAGGNISVNDTVASDLIIGGGDIEINGFIGDDVRVAGGNVTITGEIMDDLIVFGGDVKISPQSVIHGNIVSYSGEVAMDGRVKGGAKMSGGQISIDGTIEGPATLSAGNLIIGQNAQFLSNVGYWSENGEVDFGNSVQNGEARYDTSLGWETNNYSDETTWIGISFFFGFMFILGGLLLLLLLEWAFGSWFTEASNQVMAGWPRSLGIGVLYVIGVPVLILFSFIIIIGIPVGLFATFLYLFSLFFGNFVAALILTHLWKARKGKNWNVLITALVALLVAIVIQLLTSIPLLGALISFIVLCISYGAIILAIRSGKTSTPAQGGNSGQTLATT